MIVRVNWEDNNSSVLSAVTFYEADFAAAVKDHGPDFRDDRWFISIRLRAPLHTPAPGKENYDQGVERRIYLDEVKAVVLIDAGTPIQSWYGTKTPAVKEIG